MKKTAFEVLVDLIREKPLGSVLRRWEIVEMANGKRGMVTLDNYRNWMTKAGYLEWFEPGVYIRIKDFNQGITSRQLRREAYPRYYQEKGKDK